jgi:hypothetical protein
MQVETSWNFITRLCTVRKYNSFENFFLADFSALLIAPVTTRPSSEIFKCDVTSATIMIDDIYQWNQAADSNQMCCPSGSRVVSSTINHITNLYSMKECDGSSHRLCLLILFLWYLLAVLFQPIGIVELQQFLPISLALLSNVFVRLWTWNAQVVVSPDAHYTIPLHFSWSALHRKFNRALHCKTPKLSSGFSRKFVQCRKRSGTRWIIPSSIFFWVRFRKSSMTVQALSNWSICRSHLPVWLEIVDGAGQHGSKQINRLLDRKRTHH